MRDLIRVIDCDTFTTLGGKKLYFVKADTVEDNPRHLTLRTWDWLKASLCQRAKGTPNLLWAEYQHGWYAKGWDEYDLTKIEPDSTKWQHDGQAAS